MKMKIFAGALAASAVMAAVARIKFRHEADNETERHEPVETQTAA